MQYIFRVIKNENIGLSGFDSTDEAFESAVHCSSSVVKSILFDLPVNVGCTSPEIIISTVEGKMPISISKCEDMIKNAFCDSNGIIYPEFSKIERVTI